MAVNEYGIAVCVLNGANVGGGGADRTPSASRSRGHLTASIIAAETVADVCGIAASIDLTAYAPFTLAVFEPGLPAALIEWNGENAAILPDGDSFMPLLSSSFDTQAVRCRRREEFSRAVARTGRPDASALWAFHSSHGSGPSAYSPCMHRGDAETVSFSWLMVDADWIRFFYAPGPPCRWSPGEEVTWPISKSGKSHATLITRSIYARQ
jgi:hypothetical protein